MSEASTPLTENRVMHGSRPYAFRCKNCGFLEHCDAAGECSHPHACRVCSAGVSYHTHTGYKTVHSDNWEHLADATSDRLSELGLTADQVVRHTLPTQTAPGRQPKNISTSATDNVVPLDTTTNPE